MCKEKTLESLLKFVEFVSSIEANTCEIETSKTQETFTELPQKKGERSIWIIEQNPLPPCGRKDIIKYLPAEKNWWHIQYEHVVLNKQPKDDDGKSCKEFGWREPFSTQWLTHGTCHVNTSSLPTEVLGTDHSIPSKK